MLDFSHSLVVCPSLFLPVSSVTRGQGETVVGVYKGIKDPNIKKCTLPIVLQETLCLDIKDVPYP